MPDRRLAPDPSRKRLIIWCPQISKGFFFPWLDGWFLGVVDHQMTSLLACYQPLQILIWANECKIFVGLSVPTNSLTTFDLHN